MTGDDYTPMSDHGRADRAYRDANRREPSCDHIQALANCGVVRRRARALVEFLEEPADLSNRAARVEWTGRLAGLAADVRAALGGDS